jgi:urease accessory protein UreE
MAIRRVLILGVALALGALATAASGQEARKYYMVDTVTVSDVNADHHVLEVTDHDGARMRFVIDEKTEVQEGGDVITFSELEKGDRVAVNARAPAPDVESHPPIAEVILILNEDTAAE